MPAGRGGLKERPAGSSPAGLFVPLVSSDLALARRRHRDPDGFAAPAREAGEHRFDQVRNQYAEVVLGRARFGMAVEQLRIIGPSTDVEVEEAAVFGVDPY